MSVVGESVIKVPKFGFRLEIDEIGDLNLESCGELSEEMDIIEDHEGGRQTIADHSPGKFSVKEMPCVRVLDLNDTRIRDWWENLKAGNQDKRNGTFFWTKASTDVAKMEIREMLLKAYSGGSGDAKSKDENQKETFTLKPKLFGVPKLL